MTKIAFFDTKPYDKASFDSENRNFNFSISYFDSWLSEQTVSLTGGFGIKVLAFDKFPNKELEQELHFEYSDLDNLYSQSDIISLHCPLNNETHHIIDVNAINKMKDGVMIINTSRGGLIDSKALLENLKNYKIGSAGLDVYEEDSEFFFEDYSSQILTDDILARLLTLPNVLITSHQAFFTKEALGNIAQTTLNNIKNYFEKNKLENEICYRCDSDSCLKEKEGKCF